MKSVKSKLFISYSLTIFIVLFLLSSSGIYFFSKNYEAKTFNQLETTLSLIEKTLIVNQKIDLGNIPINNNIFVSIVKNKKLLQTTLSINKSKDILSKYDYKINNFDEEDHEYDGYLEVNDYIIKFKSIIVKNDEYQIYIGIYEFILDEFLDDIYLFVSILIIILFIILIVLGYVLINKTIRPLKSILEDVSTMKNKKDLASRLLPQNTNDEFEELTTTFNEMLKWIENNVNNIKQFSSDASHELRTPLTIIQGEIELYKKGNLSKEEIHETLITIDSEQKKLQNIIQDFLLLSKLDKETLSDEKSLLDKVIFDVIELNLAKIEEKNLELELEIDEDLEISFSEKYLFIVINNLLSNSIKYTQNGTIKIEAKIKENDIYFLIKDTGIGIPKKDLSRIFERFYRVDEVRTNSQEGIGLGLAIVKKICESFNYTINVDSQVNKGSTFIIRRPDTKS